MEQSQAGQPDLKPHRPVALLVEYDGGQYHGLQKQKSTPETVQEYLENAAGTVGSTDIDFIASGRTDTGVHATGQVVRMKLPETINDYKVPLALNANLPDSIRIRKAVTCDSEFHPRFDARQRTYIYRLIDRDPVVPIYRNFVAGIRVAMDVTLAHEAANTFEGFWELKEWRSSMCQATRTKLHIDCCKVAGPAADRPFWEVTIKARSFLHNQVRFMVGGIVAVASGKLLAEELKQALEQGTRPVIVKKELACGLTLHHIDFAKGKNPFKSE